VQCSWLSTSTPCVYDWQLGKHVRPLQAVQMLGSKLAGTSSTDAWIPSWLVQAAQMLGSKLAGTSRTDAWIPSWLGPIVCPRHLTDAGSRMYTQPVLVKQYTLSNPTWHMLRRVTARACVRCFGV
jgi:hypothetical protein